MHICVYTVITGEYDNLREIEYKNENLDYFCFTNDKSLISDTWDIIYINEPLDNQLLQRKVKILCCEYLSDYDLSLYIDGKVTVRKDVLPFINTYLKRNVDLVGFKHPQRSCIYDEIYFCVVLGKEKLSTGLYLQEMYRSEGYPHNYGLSDTAIMIRRHNEAVKQLMVSWFHMVETYSRRDQLSLFYCIWKSPTRISTVFLNDNIGDNEFFLTSHYHSAKRKQKKKRYLADFNSDGKYDVNLLVEGTYTSGLPVTILKVEVPLCCKSFKINVDEIGNSLLEYSTDSDLTIETIYGIPLNDQFIFFHFFSIKVCGNMQRGRIVEVKLKINELSRIDLLSYFIQYNSERLCLIKNVEDIKAQVQVIKTSKSFRIGRIITWLPRKLRNTFRRRMR